MFLQYICVHNCSDYHCTINNIKRETSRASVLHQDLVNNNKSVSALFCDDDGDDGDGDGDDDGDDDGDGNSGSDVDDGDGDGDGDNGSGMASAAWALYSTPQEISSRRPSGPL